MRARARPCSSMVSIGSTKAAVLPVPVCAMPSTSRRASTWGIACSWMGVGIVYPADLAAARTLSDKPSWVKGIEPRIKTARSLPAPDDETTTEVARDGRSKVSIEPFRREHREDGPKVNPFGVRSLKLMLKDSIWSEVADGHGIDSRSNRRNSADR